jgi:hypothetical protein
MKTYCNKKRKSVHTEKFICTHINMKRKNALLCDLFYCLFSYKIPESIQRNETKMVITMNTVHRESGRVCEVPPTRAWTQLTRGWSHTQTRLVATPAAAATSLKCRQEREKKFKRQQFNGLTTS